MKKSVMLLIASAICFTLHAQTRSNVKAETEVIKYIIQTAYVEGLQNEGDTVKINQGFHPGFELLIPGKEGELEKYTLAEWKAKVKANLASGKLPRREEEKISVNFIFIDITGDAAVAKFEFFVGKKLAYMDYQCLYKYPDGWKIVSKIFHKYQ